MDLIKLCPACREKNPVSEVICRVCMTNLSSVSPTSANTEPQKPPVASCVPEGEMTVHSTCPVLTLLRSDGRPVPVTDGSELGRSGDCYAFFCDIKTVSRRHAKITRNAGEWRIEDIGSTNGTWLNGQRLEPGRAYPIATGDTVRLSLSCELKVIA